MSGPTRPLPSAGPHAYELQLRASPASVRKARQFFRYVGGFLHLPPEKIADGALAVSELVSDVIVGADEPVVVRACPLADGVRIEVVDRSGVGIDPDADPVRRHAFAIVDAVATDWGSETQPGQRSKTVWFTLQATTR